MPLTPEAAEAPTIKKNFEAAQHDLDATDVTDPAVVNAVEQLTGDQRTKALADLAADSETRKALFKQLADTYDHIQALKPKAAQTLSDSERLDRATKIQPLLETYDNLKSQIELTNLSSSQFQSVMEEAYSDKEDAAAQGKQKIADLKTKFADFPSRLKAISEFEDRYKDYDTIKLAISGAEDLKRLLQGSGVLEFHILADGVTVSQADLQAMEARLGPEGKGPLPQPGDKIRWMEVDQGALKDFDRPGAPPRSHEWNGKHYMPVLVTPDASLDKISGSWGLENARPSQDPNGGRAVSFSFNPVGGKLFGDLTTLWHDNALKISPDAKSALAIVLDNKLISAPNLLVGITGGSGEITGGGVGGFTQADQEYLIDTLNAGSLPAQLSSEPISEEQVGPTLGADNLNRGLRACAFGLVVIGVFLISYYYLAGAVAFFAVVMNVILILGVMSALAATFTLPSIAGIVLTIGTAVDANVLIFERLREEQHKGLPLRMALRNSYNQAQSAIIDSNMTSAITSLCLYLFGSEEVKGFGLTLLIGIVASLFTALYVTKTIFGIMIDHFGMKELGSLPLTFPKWDKALKPDWDWMGKAWIFYTFSIIMISIGLVLFTIKAKEGFMMDIEFATGTSVQVKLIDPMSQDKIRDIINAESLKDPISLPAPSVVAVGKTNDVYEIVTPQIDREKVRGAVLDALSGKLKLQLPSTFDLVGADYATARDKTILPITDSKFSVDGFTPSEAAQHIGGVALVLRNISPPLSVNQIQQRMDNERASSSSGTIGSIDYKVQAPGDPDAPTSFAVIVGSNASVSFAADEGKWSQELADPLWGMTKDSINRPPSFEKETNFDPQVAGEMQRDAFLALTFSIAAIMVYIWVRFGTFRYGTATVVALLHDTVFTLAAMGFAHYIAQFWQQNFLEIEPFRINLTVVAGILTIMGYSMIDTIVVFDRIRENRGRYGHLNRKVINDAINQTLSRTLLTCGTTIITVSFMYFLGGAGIHGFTFVLLVGILVGTYSSVAIAAPMLLWGHEEPKTRAGRPSSGLLPPAQAAQQNAAV
jgi:SecD/SecF fusion protein